MIGFISAPATAILGGDAVVLGTRGSFHQAGASTVTLARRTFGGSAALIADNVLAVGRVVSLGRHDVSFVS